MSETMENIFQNQSKNSEFSPNKESCNDANKKYDVKKDDIPSITGCLNEKSEEFSSNDRNMESTVDEPTDARVKLNIKIMDNVESCKCLSVKVDPIEDKSFETDKLDECAPEGRSFHSNSESIFSHPNCELKSKPRDNFFKKDELCTSYPPLNSHKRRISNEESPSNCECNHSHSNKIGNNQNSLSASKRKYINIYTDEFFQNIAEPNNCEHTISHIRPQVTTYFPQSSSNIARINANEFHVIDSSNVNDNFKNNSLNKLDNIDVLDRKLNELNPILYESPSRSFTRHVNVTIPIRENDINIPFGENDNHSINEKIVSCFASKNGDDYTNDNEFHFHSNEKLTNFLCKGIDNPSFSEGNNHSLQEKISHVNAIDCLVCMNLYDGLHCNVKNVKESENFGNFNVSSIEFGGCTSNCPHKDYINHSHSENIDEFSRENVVAFSLRDNCKNSGSKEFINISCKNDGRKEIMDQTSRQTRAYEELLSSVGNDGRYQWWVFIVASFSGLFLGFHSLGAAFLAATPEFVCDVTYNSNAELIYMPPKNFTMASTVTKVTCFLNKSLIYELHQLEYEIDEESSNELVKCKSWIYDNSLYEDTIVTQWDLVCENQWWMTFVQVSFMSGVLLGSLISGELSDMYGRRTIVLISTVGAIISGITAALSINLLMFLILRFLTACFLSGIYFPCFVIVMELCGQEYRSRLGIYYQMMFSLGFCLLPFIAYFVKSWSNLQFVISLPSILLLFYFKFLPESPRWLLCQNRKEEALKILKNAAQINNKALPKRDNLIKILSAFQQVEKTSETIFAKILMLLKNQFALFKTPILRRRCCIIFFTWFAVSMSYFGLSFNGANINASVHLTLFLSGIVEFPSLLITVELMKRYGRKKNIVISFIICGLCCIFILVVPKDQVWLNMALAAIGKYFATTVFAIAYIFSAELVPTKVRNISVGTSSMWARVGAGIAPFIVDSLGSIHYAIPSTVFGVLCIAAGLLDLLLPETGNKPLPETIEEIELLER